MRDPSEPPARIARIVRSGDDWLEFPGSRRPWIWLTIGMLGSTALILLGGLLVVVAIAAATVVGVSADKAFEVVFTTAFMPSLVLFGLGTLLGFLGTRTPRNVRIEDGKATLQGFWAPAMRPMGEVRLDGKPGRMMVLRSGRRKIASFRPRVGSTGWDFDSVTWLGRRASELLQIPFADDRSEADWRRWETDPLYRAEMRWDALLESNQSRFQRHHAEPPRPAPFKVDLDGMKMMLDTGIFSDTLIRITNTHLVLANREYRLDQITRAGVSFEKRSSKNSTRYYGKLQILVGGRVKSIAKMKVTNSGGKKAGQLHWAAAEIMRYVATAQAPRDEGSVRDVPDEIAQMVRPQRETQ